MIKVKDVKVSTLTADTLGDATSGCIKVQGWLKLFPPPKNADEDESDSGDGDDTWMFETPAGCFAEPDQTPFPTADKWYLLPVLEATQRFDGKMEKKIIGLMLSKTGTENEYRRIGRFYTLGDEALKFFARPTYSFEEIREGEGEDNVKVGKVKSGMTLGWPFQKNPWVESVITIV